MAQGKRPWTRIELINHLEEAERKHGFVGVSWLLRNTPAGRSNLRWAIRTHFGSISKAKESAHCKPWKTWNKRTLRAAIHDIARNGTPLNYSKIAPHHRNVMAAAERLHGSWRAAVAASGLAILPLPNRMSRSKYSPAMVQALIRKEWELSGDVTAKRLTARFGEPIYLAAHRFFGNWRGALKAADLPHSLIKTPMAPAVSARSLIRPGNETSLPCRGCGGFLRVTLKPGVLSARCRRCRKINRVTFSFGSTSWEVRTSDC